MVGMLMQVLLKDPALHCIQTLTTLQHFYDLGVQAMLGTLMHPLLSLAIGIDTYLALLLVVITPKFSYGQG